MKAPPIFSADESLFQGPSGGKVKVLIKLSSTKMRAQVAPYTFFLFISALQYSPHFTAVSERTGDIASSLFSLELSLEGLAHFLQLGQWLKAFRMARRGHWSSTIIPSVLSCLLGLMIHSDSFLLWLYWLYHTVTWQWALLLLNWII